MQVQIYISHSYRAPRKTKGVYGYILVYHDPQGREATKTVFREAEATPHEADLMAAVEALQALNRPCEVEIIGCSYLSSAEQWISRWRENGWKNAKGQEIAHKDLWQQYNSQILRHRVKFGISGSFTDWLETEIRKKKRKLEDKGMFDKFGEFDSTEELNAKAAELKATAREKTEEKVEVVTGENVENTECDTDPADEARINLRIGNIKDRMLAIDGALQAKRWVTAQLAAQDVVNEISEIIAINMAAVDRHGSMDDADARR